MAYEICGNDRAASASVLRFYLLFDGIHNSISIGSLEYGRNVVIVRSHVG